MNDEHLSVPKYHFNRKAAYAFAARFYLFYVQKDKSNYDKVIQYAGEVLGNTPAEVLRDWATMALKKVTTPYVPKPMQTSRIGRTSCFIPPFRYGRVPMGPIKPVHATRTM